MLLLELTDTLLDQIENLTAHGTALVLRNIDQLSVMFAADRNTQMFISFQGLPPSKNSFGCMVSQFHTVYLAFDLNQVKKILISSNCRKTLDKPSEYSIMNIEKAPLHSGQPFIAKVKPLAAWGQAGRLTRVWGCKYHQQSCNNHTRHETQDLRPAPVIQPHHPLSTGSG